MGQQGHILFIDAYDSFSNNIIALVQEHTHAKVSSIKVDDARYFNDSSDACGEFAGFLRQFDAVIVGPGPGSPVKESDVGIIAQLWQLPKSDLLPVLGICLGFQSLAHAYGAKIKPLAAPQHGLIANVVHRGESIFRDVGDIHAVQYNSLHVVLHGQKSAEELGIDSNANTPRGEPFLHPLAWTKPDDVNDRILMALEHTSKPFWGVQYHPESICTNVEGAKIILNWWEDAKSWNETHDRRRACLNPAATSILSTESPRIVSSSTSSESLCVKDISTQSPSNVEADMSWKSLKISDLDVVTICETLGLHDQETVLLESGTGPTGRPVDSLTGRFSIIGCDKSEDSERLQYEFNTRQLIVSIGRQVTSVQTVDDIWLYLELLLSNRRRSTGPPLSPFWGGLIGSITYEAGLGVIDVETAGTTADYPDMCFTFVQRSIVVDHVENKIYVQSVHPNDMPWINRVHSILLGKGTLFGSLRKAVARSKIWLSQRSCFTERSNFAASLQIKEFRSYRVDAPGHDDYLAKVKRCQTLIRAGESYELCLTGQTTVYADHSHPSWSIYRRLRNQNPASHGACLQFAYSGSRCSEGKQEDTGRNAECLESTLTILSSSPERFLSWTRPAKATSPYQPHSNIRVSPLSSGTVSSTLQFRPIKGTAPKTTCRTLESATEILHQPKERAENLMIVDLIRHDLRKVAQDVRVVDLMRVEEARNVWHLVSVIEGTMYWDVKSIANSTRATNAVSQSDTSSVTAAKSPIAALATSLPPGSMTGAPKKRSCALLVVIEAQNSPTTSNDTEGEAEAASYTMKQKRRGIYSGVFGFLDVGGAGEWAVAIRCAWKTSRREGPSTHIPVLNKPPRADVVVKAKECDYEHWHIGAGGAITTLSDPEAEWEEMLHKRAGVLGVFADLYKGH